jgi:hypothetical protein
MPHHACLDALNQVHVRLGDVLEVPREYADLSVVVVHLTA